MGVWFLLGEELVVGMLSRIAFSHYSTCLFFFSLSLSPISSSHTHVNQTNKGIGKSEGHGKRGGEWVLALWDAYL